MATSTNNAFDQYKVRVGLGTTSELKTITSYEGTVRNMVSSGTSPTQFVITGAEAIDNLYVGVIITVDLDGDETTGDDIFDRTITAYVGATATVTVDSALGRTPTAASTYIIYTRMATLDSALTAVAFASDFAANTPEVIGGAAVIGDTAVTLGASAGTTLNMYQKMTVVFDDAGVIQTRTIKYYTTGKVAELDQPLTSDLSTTATYLIYRDYEIYYDLGSGCLANVDVRITYSIGYAKTISNDPGK